VSGNGSEREHHTHASFEESAKKFKPGPVAPPETEAQRHDMGGVEPTREPPALTRRVDEMPEGEPGVFKKMPGED
jgi:hypothetical protein